MEVEHERLRSAHVERAADDERAEDIPGKEVLMLTVEFAPGGANPIHRHNAHGFIYVLEGSVVMQVKGEGPVTLTAGQTF